MSIDYYKDLWYILHGDNMENIEITNRIKYFIETNNISRRKFAKGIGFSASHISDVLNNKVNLSPKLLMAICYRYNLNMEWLETGDGEMYKNDNSLELNYAMSLFNDLDKISRKFILKILRALNDEDEEINNFNKEN